LLPGRRRRRRPRGGGSAPPPRVRHRRALPTGRLRDAGARRAHRASGGLISRPRRRERRPIPAPAPSSARASSATPRSAAGATEVLGMPDDAAAAVVPDWVSDPTVVPVVVSPQGLLA